MEYSCENAHLINEDIFGSLFKAASSGASLAAIEKIKDPEKKERIQRQIFPERFPSSHALPLTSLELLPSSSPPLLTFDEKEICLCLIEGDAKKLRLLLDNGLNPDYVLTQNISVSGLTFQKGYTLLLLVLQACVATNDVSCYLEIIFLLFEEKASLEQECRGTTPLWYVCEHGGIFPEDLVVCFLSSVNKVLAFHIVSKIPDLKYKERIASLIHSKELVFQFEPIKAKDEEKQKIQMIKEDLLTVTDIHSAEQPDQSIFEKESISEEKTTLYAAFDVSLTSDETSLSLEPSTSFTQSTSAISQKVSVIKEEKKETFSISDFFKKLTRIIVNIEQYHAPYASLYYGDKVVELLSQIISNDFSGLENTLQNPELLKACNQEVSGYTTGKETLLSVLLNKLNNPYFKHKVCYLFLKYGLNKEEKICANLNLLAFLCSFRPGNKAYPFILQQTVLLVIFYYNDETLTKEAIKHCNTKQEKKSMLSFFTDTGGNFSIQHIYLPNIICEGSYKNFVLAFLEASLLFNKNIITGKSWDARVIFPLLEELASFLKRQSLSVGSLSMKRKMMMISLLEALLVVGIHPDSYKEDYANLYINFFKKNEEIVYESLQIKKEVDFLLQKYWGWIFNKEEASKSKSSIFGPRSFLGLFNEPTGRSYGSKISEVSECVKVNDFSKLKSLLEDNKALNQCNWEVKYFFNKETCFSALLHTVRDPILRHKIFFIFLQYGLSLNEIVYENMTILHFLCKLRGNILTINTNKGLLLQTLCLGLFLLEDKSELIEVVINNCCPEDRKRLKDFFYDKTTEKFSNKNLCLEDNISSPIYFLVKKAMVEASIIVSRNIITNKPWNLNDINSCLGLLIKNLSTLFTGCDKPQSSQEIAMTRKNKLIYLYEFLLVFTALHQFSLEDKTYTYSLLKQQLEEVPWKNKETKLLLLMLLQRHLGFVIRDSKKRKGSTEEGIEKKLKFLSTPIQSVNMKNMDLFYVSFDYGSKVTGILSHITNDDFSQLEEVLKNPFLLEEYNKEVNGFTSGQETLLSALMYKLNNINIQNRVCCLFLKYGLSLDTIVSRQRNTIRFFCGLKKPYTASSMLKIICLFVLAFKNEISWDDLLEACINLRDRRKLKEFFMNSQGNFSISKVNINSLVINSSYAPLVQAFVDASVCLNRNVITDEPWDTSNLFSWIRQLIKVLSNMRKISPMGICRKKALISTFETLLIGAIQENSYKISNNDEYLFILRQPYFFKNSDIKKEIEALIQKYWGYLQEK